MIVNSTLQYNGLVGADPTADIREDFVAVQTSKTMVGKTMKIKLLFPYNVTVDIEAIFEYPDIIDLFPAFDNHHESVKRTLEDGIPMGSNTDPILSRINFQTLSIPENQKFRRLQNRADLISFIRAKTNVLTITLLFPVSTIVKTDISLTHLEIAELFREADIIFSHLMEAF